MLINEDTDRSVYESSGICFLNSIRKPDGPISNSCSQASMFSCHLLEERPSDRMPRWTHKAFHIDMLISGHSSYSYLYVNIYYILDKEMVINSSILAWKIPWTEKPGGLQSIGLQRAGHD